MQAASESTPESFRGRIVEDDWKRLAGLGSTRTCGANEALFRHGDPAGHVLLVVEGRIRIAISAPSLGETKAVPLRADKRRLEQAAHSAAERLAAFLLRLADQPGAAAPDGVKISVQLSQQDTAGAIGTSREAVVRGLRTLRERGVVITRRRKLVIAVP